MYPLYDDIYAQSTAFTETALDDSRKGHVAAGNINKIRADVKFGFFERPRAGLSPKFGDFT